MELFQALNYTSKQLIKREKNYLLFLLEMDAVVWAMLYYQEHLRGRRFILYRTQASRDSGNITYKNHKQTPTGHDGF
jgi:hypothetical protein